MSPRTDRPSELEGMEVGGCRPGEGGLGGSSPSPPPEVWLGSGSQEAGPHPEEEGGRRKGEGVWVLSGPALGLPG